MPNSTKTFMTWAVSAGLLLVIGMGAAIWATAGRSPGAERSAIPALVLVSPLPGEGIEPQDDRAPEPSSGNRHPNAQDDSPRPNPPRTRQKPAREGEARLAIVIDDLGYNLSAPERLLALNQPVTFSIIPQQPYSREVAERARRAGRTFLVHLPMEPEDYPRENPGANALMLSMDSGAMRAAVTEQLDSLPGAFGANNHMGSAFTADAGRMAIVQELIARRGMVFLNSKTSATTVPGEIARARGYSYLERDVFLDNERSEVAIRSQLRRAIERAREQGHAIAIGHPYPETLRVLRDRLPALSREGVLLVPISEL